MNIKIKNIQKMKQLTAYLGLFIAAFFANNSVLSQDTIPPPPVRDSMIVEYYFCWARELGRYYLLYPDD